MEAPNIPAIVSRFIEDQPQRSGKSGRIWPSDLGVALGPKHGGCTLAFWLKCRNEPVRPKKPGEKLMLDMGDKTHTHIADLLEDALEGTGWSVSYREVRVEIEVNGETVAGRIDIMLYHADGRIHIIDVKSKRGAAFKFLNEARPGDVLQVQSYMKAVNATSGSVLYVDREGQNFMREFDVPREDHRPELAITKLQEIRDSEIPPAPVQLGITRNENKGPDSFKVTIPWQIGWCDLQKCACKASLPCKTVPKGIVGKLHPDKAIDGTEFLVVKLTEEGETVRSLVLGLLEEKYPDETFILEEKEDA
jgi:hypothetical protein